MSRRLIQVLFVVSLYCRGGVLGAQAKGESTNARINVAVLSLLNVSADRNAAHWQYTIPKILDARLQEMSSLRALPDTSLRFAFRELKLDPAQALKPEQARKLGEVIEARHVIWGSYRRDDAKWSLTVQIMNVASAKTSEALTAASANWAQIVSNIAEQLVRQLGLVPDLNEEKRVKCLRETSAEALELMSRALAESERRSISTTEQDLRRVVDLDPASARARRQLAHVLTIRNQLDEATDSAFLATKMCPQDAEAHATLGRVYLFRKLKSLAQHEFEEAIRLDPDSPDFHIGLGIVLGQQGKHEEASDSLRKAATFAPYDSFIRVELARAYLLNGEREKAQAELKLAERYDWEYDPGIARSLAQVYVTLNEVPSAIQYYEKYVAGAKKLELPASHIQEIEETLSDLRARLALQFVQAPVLRLLTPTECRRALKERLGETNNEPVLPFATTPEISAWAKRLAGDAKDDMEKAHRLFQGLVRHVNLGRETGERTAAEAFRDWSNPKATITCQDYTFLYMAMGRHVGLNVYYVLVEKDYLNKPVFHACAGVVLKEKAFLVDPAYNWFGVPHKKYEFEDDLRVVGAYLIYSGDMAKQDLGLKLANDWGLPHLSLASYRLSRGQVDQAREVLQAGLKLDSKNALSFYVRAGMDIAEKKWDAAVTHSRECLRIDPDASVAHFVLGEALYGQGNLIESRNEFRLYLQGETVPETADKARDAIARLNEVLPDLRP
jgi:Tfp pilus assembly protein PilF/TolB-like protein